MNTIAEIDGYWVIDTNRWSRVFYIKKEVFKASETLVNYKKLN